MVDRIGVDIEPTGSDRFDADLSKLVEGVPRSQFHGPINDGDIVEPVEVDGEIPRGLSDVAQVSGVQRAIHVECEHGVLDVEVHRHGAGQSRREVVERLELGAAADDDLDVLGIAAFVRAGDLFAGAVKIAELEPAVDRNRAARLRAGLNGHDVGQKQDGRVSLVDFRQVHVGAEVQVDRIIGELAGSVEDEFPGKVRSDIGVGTEGRRRRIGAVERGPGTDPDVLGVIEGVGEFFPSDAVARLVGHLTLQLGLPLQGVEIARRRKLRIRQFLGIGDRPDRIAEADSTAKPGDRQAGDRLDDQRYAGGNEHRERADLGQADLEVEPHVGQQDAGLDAAVENGFVLFGVGR